MKTNFITSGLQTRIRLYSVVVFFMIAILSGLAACGDYGISADEPQMRGFGGQVLLYLFFNGAEPFAFDWAFHNPITHVLYAGLLHIWNISDGPRVWLARHVLSYGFFLLTYIALYRIGLRLFKGKWYFALLACYMLLLSPRVFAHSFYNPKDIPALIAFTISMATLLYARAGKYNWSRLVPHALACAISISLRTSGVFVVLFTMGTLVFDLRPSYALIFKKSTLFIGSCFVCMWAIWPRLWTAPVSHFIEAFTSNASREGGGLYLGQFLDYTPWHYVFVWMTITTPIVYSLFFVVGLGNIVTKIIRSPQKFAAEETNWILILLWYIGPLAALIIMHVGIFGEWRHVLFIYPAFILIAVRGFQTCVLQKEKIVRYSSAALLSVSLLSTGFWMMRNHPREYAYFSIPSTWVEGNFEKDYWAVSFYEALQWITTNDDSSLIPIYTTARIGYVNMELLLFDDWIRVAKARPEQAAYIIDNYQWNQYKQAFPKERAVYTISVDGLDIASIYKGPDTLGVYPEQNSSE